MTRNRMLIDQGIQMARHLGHRMGRPELDADMSGMLAECQGCSRYLAANVEESPEPWGMVLRQKCSGKVLA